MQPQSLSDRHLLRLPHQCFMPCHLELCDQRLFCDVSAPWQDVTLGHHPDEFIGLSLKDKMEPVTPGGTFYMLMFLSDSARSKLTFPSLQGKVYGCKQKKTHFKRGWESSTLSAVCKIKVASYFQGTLIALSIWIVFPQRQWVSRESLLVWKESRNNNKVISITM